MRPAVTRRSFFVGATAGGDFRIGSCKVRDGPGLRECSRDWQPEPRVRWPGGRRLSPLPAMPARVAAVTAAIR